VGNVHIKNSVVDVGVRSGNGTSLKQNWVYKQNICVKNSSEVQTFKILIDNKAKCKSIGQRNTARKQPEAPVSNDTINVEHILGKDSSLVPRNKSIKIFHQSIGGLGNKSNKLYCHLHHYLPHNLCLSEHHLSESELQLIHLTNYSPGANYCRKNFLKGGVSIFVYRNLKYKTINIYEYDIDKVIEACAIQLDSTFNSLCILAIYRSPRGDFTIFLKRLDLILQKLYNNKYRAFHNVLRDHKNLL
jgi:hypothetical protein